MDDEYACCASCEDNSYNAQFPLRAFKVDMSAWVEIFARTEDEAWEKVNRMFSQTFYDYIKAMELEDGEISIDEVALEE
jgi:hypothetical protein